jgi:D-serine deaminase-like pyridoxal phosphate-dependent protein
VTSLTSIAAPRLPRDLVTPALVVDLDVMERNIAGMQAAMAERGIALRPHTKTHRSVEIARRQLAAGAGGITVGTLGEAEVMAAGGIDDIFVAYPVWAGGPNASRIRALNDAVRLSVGVDSAAAAAALGEAVRGSRPLDVLVEIDSGDHRTGAPDAEAAATVATAAQRAGLRVRGLFTHGGHGYRPEAADQAADDEVAALAAAADALRGAGIEASVRSAGSTPTALLSARDGVTEERPGTYVFGDRQMLHLGAASAQEMALWVVATVISTSVQGQFVVDAGAKTLAKDLPSFLEGYGALAGTQNLTVERTYDYHGVVRLPDGAAPPPVGSQVAILPNHVCPVVNLAETLVIVRGGEIVDRWPVDARARNG